MARELKGYAAKAAAKTHPYVYDKDSKAFNQGAWKNQNPETAQQLRRAIERGGRDQH